jgi:uncharacterized protein
MQRILFIVLGSLCVALGVIGIFVPLMPTTVFLLLAGFFYARSSPRFYNWLLNHRWLGTYLRNYRDGRGVPMRDKVVTLVVLWLSIALTTVFFVRTWWIILLLLVIAAGVTIHLVSLKTYRPEKENLQESN